MLLKRDEIDAMVPRAHRHQFNEQRGAHDAIRCPTPSACNASAFIWCALPPGRYSTEFHYHDADEEFLYVLSGRGIAEIGDERFEVGPGDFMGFGAPSKPHAMRNPFDEDLVYLMGGERNVSDVVHYPPHRADSVKKWGPPRLGGLGRPARVARARQKIGRLASGPMPPRRRP